MEVSDSDIFILPKNVYTNTLSLNCYFSLIDSFTDTSLEKENLEKAAGTDTPPTEDVDSPTEDDTPPNPKEQPSNDEDDDDYPIYMEYYDHHQEITTPGDEPGTAEPESSEVEPLDHDAAEGNGYYLPCTSSFDYWNFFGGFFLGIGCSVLIQAFYSFYKLKKKTYNVPYQFDSFVNQ